MDLVGQRNQIIPDTRRTTILLQMATILLLKDYGFCTCNTETGMILLSWHIKTNKITYKTNKILICSHFYFYCGCSNIIIAIETDMFRLLFYAMKGVNLMELSMREKKLLIMFGNGFTVRIGKRLYDRRGKVDQWLNKQLIV